MVAFNPSVKEKFGFQLSKSNEDILSHKILSLDEIEDILNANNDPRLLPDLLQL